MPLIEWRQHLLWRSSSGIPRPAQTHGSYGRLRLSICALTLATSAATATMLGASDHLANEPTQPPDCGIYSLFLLFQLEGHPVRLAEIERALPPRAPDGYSMAELARAAGSLGLQLEGISLDDDESAPDRPVIAYFNNEHQGHFSVMQPVGTTGMFVQIIDPPHQPHVIDYSNFKNSDVWTGRALYPSRGWVDWRQVVPLLGVCWLLLLIIFGLLWARPTKAHFSSMIARIFSLKSIRSRNP